MLRVLITGGAGFIGSHAADVMLAAGYEVRILDNLSPQVHGPQRQRPAYLTREAELLIGDVTDPAAVERALRGIDIVLHLASSVGVGQSMYDIEPYVRTNELGTAVLLQALAKHPVERLVVASSMSIYGEGACRSADGAAATPSERAANQLRQGDWELRDALGQPLEPIPTPETKEPTLSSIYALNKYAQERMCLIWGQAYGRDVTAMRFFNVYGPDQALSNPYTGVLAIFGSRLLNGRPPMIFEDGLQRRDFVHVRDVARACRLALESSAASGLAINVGSGESRTVQDVARTLARAMGHNDMAPQITGKYRAGDIRHCFSDITLARTLLGFEPQVTFEDGIAELVEWLKEQIATDSVEQATAELSRRGLVA